MAFQVFDYFVRDFDGWGVFGSTTQRMEVNEIYISVDVASQYFVIIITAMMVCLFFFEYFTGKFGWEGLYVASVELCGYTLAVALPHDMNPTIGPENEPLLRYISWLLTCPILIKVLVGLVTTEKNLNDLNQLIVADILMTVTGIIGVMYASAVIKGVFFTVGMIIGTAMVRKIMKMHLAGCAGLENLNERRFYLGFFFTAWNVFPILYLFGPPMMGILSPSANVLGHSIGDFIAKNVFSLMAWKINRKWSSKGVKAVEHTRESFVPPENQRLKPIDMSTLEEEYQNRARQLQERNQHFKAIEIEEYQNRAQQKQEWPVSQHNDLLTNRQDDIRRTPFSESRALISPGVTPTPPTRMLNLTGAQRDHLASQHEQLLRAAHQMSTPSTTYRTGLQESLPQGTPNSTYRTGPQESLPSGFLTEAGDGPVLHVAVPMKYLEKKKKSTKKKKPREKKPKPAGRDSSRVSLSGLLRRSFG